MANLAMGRKRTWVFQSLYRRAPDRFDRIYILCRPAVNIVGTIMYTLHVKTSSSRILRTVNPGKASVLFCDYPASHTSICVEPNRRSEAVRKRSTWEVAPYTVLRRTCM